MKRLKWSLPTLGLLLPGALIGGVTGCRGTDGKVTGSAPITLRVRP